MQYQGTLYPPPPQTNQSLNPVWPTKPPRQKPVQTMISGNRVAKHMSFHWTLRDIQVCEALHTARYLTTHHIHALFWTESRGGESGLKKACERRMRQLFYAELVRRIEQPTKRGEGTRPFIYALAKNGAALIVAELGIDPNEVDWRPKSQEENYPFMEHLLLTTDFRIALQKACHLAGVELAAWYDERELRAVNMTDYVTLIGPNKEELKTAVIPDAAFLLDRGGKKALFFVEIDRRTVTVQPSLWERKGWTKKIMAYREYMKTELYFNRYEGRRARVLTITTGEKRLSHLQQATERVNGDSTFWFTTFEAALDPAKLLTEPIWKIAGSDTLSTLLG